MYKIYGIEHCDFCSLAITLLEREELPYKYLLIPELNMLDTVDLLRTVGSNFKTVPQITFVSETGVESYIGGYKELKTLLEA